MAHQTRISHRQNTLLIHSCCVVCRSSPATQAQKQAHAEKKKQGSSTNTQRGPDGSRITVRFKKAAKTEARVRSTLSRAIRRKAPTRGKPPLFFLPQLIDQPREVLNLHVAWVWSIVPSNCFSMWPWRNTQSTMLASAEEALGCKGWNRAPLVPHHAPARERLEKPRIAASRLGPHTT